MLLFIAEIYFMLHTRPFLTISNVAENCMRTVFKYSLFIKKEVFQVKHCILYKIVRI